MSNFINPNFSVNCKNTAPATQKIPRMLTIKATAQEFGLAEHFIRQLVIKGEVVAVRAGCKYLVNVDRLAEYLNTNTLREEQAGAEEDIYPIPANYR